MNTHDYIVIGAGSAGCAAAGRLAEDGSDTVLVLEAGGSDRHANVQIPAAGYLYSITNPKFDWRYEAQADPTRNDRRDYMPRGKTLGGSSSINGMLYLRGQPDDFDDWQALGNRNWGFESVLPYFMRAEDNENGADEYHGVGGPLAVSNLRDRHPLSEAFLDASEAVGMPRIGDLNRPPQRSGFGVVQATQRRGRRCSAARAYLWPAMKRKNMTVTTHAHVRRILVEQGRATGVEYERAGRIETAMARKAVILSAGALASPQILMLSGIGPAAHLQEMGIPVVEPLEGVGQNLQDHPGSAIIATVNVPTYNMQTGFGYKLLFGARWLLTGNGPASTPDCHLIGFGKSSEDLDRCNLQYHFTPTGYDLTSDGVIMPDRPMVSAQCNLHRPASRGWIRLKSADHRDQPAIQPNLFGDQRDLDALIPGFKLLRRIFAALPIAHYVTGEEAPGPAVQSDDEWRAYLRESALGFLHPSGTCKMGHDKMAVVDDELRVHGVAGLYVADASIMPVVVSANLNANCIMIGERCSDFVRAHTRNS